MKLHEIVELVISMKSIDFEVKKIKINIGQKVNRSHISKVVDFHLIDLKFEDDLYFRSLNSTSEL